MARALGAAGQAVFYLAVAALLGYFSARPAYVHFPPDEAQVTLSFAHGAKRKGECRRLSAEEIAALPPNMRRPMDCPRERLPVFVALEIDGKPVYEAELPPTGLAGDGPSRVYQSFKLASGRHQLVAKLRDSAREAGYDYQSAREVELAPGERLVIDFHADAGGFTFR